MNIKAKFLVTSITEYVGGKEVRLSPVMNGSKENKTFWKYTPSGEIKMHINPGTMAYDKFVVGAEYYVTFEEAKEESKEEDTEIETVVKRVIEKLREYGYNSSAHRNGGYIINIHFACNGCDAFLDEQKDAIREIAGDKLSEFYYAGNNIQHIFLRG